MWVAVNGYLINTRFITMVELTDAGNCLCHFSSPIAKPPREYELEIIWNPKTHAFWDWLMSIAHRPLRHPWTPSDTFPPMP